MTTETQTEFDFIQRAPTQTQSWFAPSQPTCGLLSPKPNYNVSFHSGSETIGYLDWNDGVMKFSGSADESAKIFFDNVIRQYFQNPDSVGPTGWKS